MSRKFAVESNYSVKTWKVFSKNDLKVLIFFVNLCRM
jgi:hypothetical protein